MGGENYLVGFWLSPQQKFAWRVLQESLRGHSRAACLVRLQGEVDPDNIRACLRRIIERHEILRTVFRRETGLKMPVQTVLEFQIILNNAVKVWAEVDLSKETYSERQIRLEDLWKVETTREVTPTEEPALRAVLVRLDQGSFALILTVHPLCADAQSLPVLVRELEIL
jgi:hypothetical protein